MSDLELLRRVGSEVPAEDPEARARALDRLRRHRQQERRSRRHRDGPRWLPAIGVAAMLAMVMAAQILLPEHLGGPRTSAAESLRALAALAVGQEPVPPPVEGYIYVRSEQLRRIGGEDLETGLSWTAFVRVTRHDWRAADGSGRILTRFGEVRFRTAADESSWRRAGRPRLIPASRTSDERLGPGEFPTRDLRELPTDERALLGALEQRVIVQGPPGAAETFFIVGLLLSEEELSPELRASLLRVAASLPGLRMLGGRVDPLGRRTVAIEVIDGGRATVLHFDLDTATILAAERFQLDPPSPRQLLDWQVYWPPRPTPSLRIPSRG